MQRKIYLTNTLSGKKELFTPLSTKKIGMYACGPTVYDLIHLGNARALLVYDLLYRLLMEIYGKDSVVYVRNITDVDDKIRMRAQEQSISISALVEDTTLAFQEDAAYLGCLKPVVEPRATQHIGEMIEIISLLLTGGRAYLKDDGLYFKVSSFAKYYELSGRDMDHSVSGVRSIAQVDKESREDFVLWKFSDESDAFESPWGKGYPGWHIECSAMAHKYLGESFDIHGGGIDLLFPHHTNEVAQSCCAFPASKFACYWVHNGFLKVNGEKMSKSLGNFITVRDIQRQGVSGSVLRYALLNAHYKKPLNFTPQLLEEAKSNIKTLETICGGVESVLHQEYFEEFLGFLCDDMNSRAAFSHLTHLCKLANSQLSNVKLKQAIRYCAEFVGMELRDVNAKIGIDEINRLILERKEAKKSRNWALVDQIRGYLKDNGVELRDLKDGEVEWVLVDDA